MKKLLSSGLVLSTLLSLTACGGQVQMAGGQVAMPQQTAVNPQNAYMQNGFVYQAPAAQAQNQLYTQPTQPVAQQTTRVSAAGISATASRNNTAPRATTPVTRPAARPATPAPAAAPKPAAQTPEQIATDLLAKSIQKFDQLQNFSITASAYEKDAKGVTNLKLKMIFQNPPVPNWKSFNTPTASLWVPNYCTKVAPTKSLAALVA